MFHSLEFADFGARQTLKKGLGATVDPTLKVGAGEEHEGLRVMTRTKGLCRAFDCLSSYSVQYHKTIRHGLHAFPHDSAVTSPVNNLAGRTKSHCDRPLQLNLF